MNKKHPSFDLLSYFCLDHITHWLYIGKYVICVLTVIYIEVRQLYLCIKENNEN